MDSPWQAAAIARCQLSLLSGILSRCILSRLTRLHRRATMSKGRTGWQQGTPSEMNVFFTADLPCCVVSKSSNRQFGGWALTT
jgi:hypothetical protein